MYSLAKELITEKDLRRQISILEILMEKQQSTAKEIAQSIGSSERTIFNDIHSIRMLLPEGWRIESEGNTGLILHSDNHQPISKVWEHFMKMSLGIQLAKALLYRKKIHTHSFVTEFGASYETLRRHVIKLNQQLEKYNLTIQLNHSSIQWTGEEINIRVFYQRLLVPFTHNNFFFENYPVHQVNYIRFIQRLNKKKVQVMTEEIFGTCWFFINAIRIKAGCSINHFIFNEKDPLFNLYREDLNGLYAMEGIILKREEEFFSFFCYLESWNYNNHWPEKLSLMFSQEYYEMNERCKRVVARIGEAIGQPKLCTSNLSENLFLFFLKYHESKQLSDIFSESQEILSIGYDRFLDLFNYVFEEIQNSDLLRNMPLSDYIVNTATLLIQEAIMKVNPPKINAYFIFQGEPAWKSFLLKELADLLGSRVQLIDASLSQLRENKLGAKDIIISNYPIEISFSQEIFYISLIPSKKELQMIKENINQMYF